MYLHANGHTESTPDKFVEFVLQNSGALTGITGFLATALFLMLSFRINRGVGRWWEGRSVYGDLLGNLRGLVQSSHLYITDKRVAVEIGIWSYAYARAVELDLRKDPEDKFTATFTGLFNIKEMDELFEHPRRPFYISDRITMKLNEAFDQGNVRGKLTLEWIVTKTLTPTLEHRYSCVGSNARTRSKHCCELGKIASYS